MVIVATQIIWELPVGIHALPKGQVEYKDRVVMRILLKGETKCSFKVQAS